MKLTVLGSGTFLPDASRGSPAHLIESGAASLLLDCGASVLQALDRAGVDWRLLDGAFISHFHTDHVGGIAPLLFALRHGIGERRRKPFHVLGPMGLTSWIHGLSKAYGPFVLEPGFPVLLQELSPGQRWVFPGGSLEIAVQGTGHTPDALAARISADGCCLGYTGDTGPNPELGRFLEGAHVLLAECAIPDPPSTRLHLTPLGVAELARAVQPDLLVTVHAYPPLEPREVPALVAQGGFRGETTHAEDGLVVQVGPAGGSRVLSPKAQRDWRNRGPSD